MTRTRNALLPVPTHDLGKIHCKVFDRSTNSNASRNSRTVGLTYNRLRNTLRTTRTLYDPRKNCSIIQYWALQFYSDTADLFTSLVSFHTTVLQSWQVCRLIQEQLKAHLRIPCSLNDGCRAHMFFVLMRQPNEMLPQKELFLAPVFVSMQQY